MEALFTTIPGIIITVGGMLTVVVIGALYVMGLFKGKKDDADDRLIKILKETVDALEIKVNKQSTDIEALTKKVDELEKENGTLIEVLQGRDKNTLEFQRQMLETVRIGMETNSLSKDINTKVADLVRKMDEHLEAVKKAQGVK
jgi:outer membrane murein-binding lipoprotein Lpp